MTRSFVFLFEISEKGNLTTEKIGFFAGNIVMKK